MFFTKYLSLGISKTGIMHIINILVVLTVETVIWSTCDAIKIKCTNNDRFLYTSPGSNCTKYYRCTASGRGEIEECEPGTAFHFKMQMCKRSAGFCHEPICTDKPNGVYPDTTHACMRSFTCNSGRMISIDNCPLKKLYNGSKCVTQELVSCTATETSTMDYPLVSDQSCTGKANGYYSIAGDCSRFLVCFKEAVSTVRSCSTGQRFHQQQQACLPQQMVTHCGGNDLMVPVLEIGSTCRNKPDGAVTDPTSTDCTTYIMCKNGEFESQRRCSHLAVFNGWSCVPSPLYQCPPAKLTDLNAELLDPCYNKPSGLHASPQHGCSFYMRCMSGRAVEIKECPTGQYFDAEIRICIYEKFTEHHRCFDRGISLDCVGKSSGFYRERDCQTYYHCYAGYKTEYKCSMGKVFNGAACVPKSQRICPTVGDDAFCANRPDGYYKDHNDGCRSYHFCSHGHKITYLCEPGYTFDSKAKKCERQQLSSSGSHCYSDYLCYGKSDGYHADYRSNCRNYVYCKNSEKITQLTCREHNVFNGQKCVPPNEYACPSLYNHRQLNCMPKQCIQQCRNDGFFPDLNSDCRDYFSCIGGKASKLSCPAGRRFNGEICVSEDKFSCPGFCNHSRDTDALSSCSLSGFAV